MMRMKLVRALRASGCRLQSTQVEDKPMPRHEYVPPPYVGPSYSWMEEVRRSLLNPALVTHFRSPLLIHAGHMQWLYDHKGARYLDLFGGIVTVSVGHCHPKVREAAEEQMGHLWHTTNIYMHPKIHEFAYRLTHTLPKHLNVVYFVNSGSEANDMAIMMARLYTGKFDILGLRNAYHGASPYSIGLTAHGNWKHSLANGFGIHHVNNPDPYQGIWGGYRDSPVQSLRANESTLIDNICSSSDLYLEQLREVLRYSVAGGRPAGFFAEAIQGVGGTVQYPKGYLKKAFELIKENGGVCIADEVQTGFGRTGEHFWGFQGHDVSPDIVTMAKGIGNGFPLAAVVTTKEIAATMGTAAHFNTYGGNPISSAVGIAVLDAIEKDETQKNSKVVGTYFLQKLEHLRDQFEIVGDVRGKGLMMGVELVSNKTTRKPIDTDGLFDIWDACKDAGVILGRGGRDGNVLRIKPPMCITKEDVDFAVSVMTKALQDFSPKGNK